MLRYKLRTLMITLAVVGAMLALGRIVARKIVPSIGYEIRAEFAEMPVDDELFRQWVEEQPGVYRAYINRDATGVNVIWGMSRDLTGYPPLPDFRNNFDRLGYRGLKRYEPVP